jgi:hypothetical protein
MSAADYAYLAVAISTLVAAFAGAVRWLVKHYLNELKPNGGDSLKDRVIRLESKVEAMYEILLKK